MMQVLLHTFRLYTAPVTVCSDTIAHSGSQRVAQLKLARLLTSGSDLQPLQCAQAAVGGRGAAAEGTSNATCHCSEVLVYLSTCRVEPMQYTKAAAFRAAGRTSLTALVMSPP